MSDISKEQLAHDLAIAYTVVQSLKPSSDVVCSGDFHKLYDENYKIFLENIENNQ